MVFVPLFSFILSCTLPFLIVRTVSQPLIKNQVLIYIGGLGLLLCGNITLARSSMVQSLGMKLGHPKYQGVLLVPKAQQEMPACFWTWSTVGLSLHVGDLRDIFSLSYSPLIFSLPLNLYVFLTFCMLLIFVLGREQKNQSMNLQHHLYWHSIHYFLQSGGKKRYHFREKRISSVSIL